MQRPTRPNVILILTDDQGYGDLACNGNPVIQTPNLDALHARSVRLENYHVSPVCTPTRSALMTGRCPNRVGCWHVVMGPAQLRKEELTAADVFSFNDYKTAIFGKWHLGDNYPFRPQDRGFEEVLVHGGGVVGHTPDHWMNNYFDDTYMHNGVKEKFAGYCTDIWFDNAIQYIRQNAETPFFVYLSLNAPHSPFIAPEEDVAVYRNNPDVPDPNFYGMISRIDRNLPRLTDELENLGLTDDTILIFMTDNGTSQGYRNGVGYNAGMRGIKGSLYDGGHRVPCWFHWPAGNLTGGRDVNRITDHVDILPTLIDLCDLRLPREVRFDGTSLSPLLKGEDHAWPDRVMVAENQLSLQPVKWRNCAVMTDRWRLVNGEELYDMRLDPGQKHDVAAANPDTVARLRAEYDRWWQSVSEHHDNVNKIITGSTHETPSKLTCYTWNNESGSQADMPWGQAHIVAGQMANGYWNVDIPSAGRYAIHLRRWPSETGYAINDTSDDDPPEKPWCDIQANRSFKAIRARVKIQGVDLTSAVEEGAREVVFSAELEQGSARLQTWFIDEAGDSRGAYYVHIERNPYA